MLLVNEDVKKGFPDDFVVLDEQYLHEILSE
jgi:hypothetical protein